MVVYLVLYFVLPEAPRGIPTFIMLGLFLGAVQLLALAVIGEYIARMFEEIKRRPNSLIQEALNYKGQKKLNEE